VGRKKDAFLRGLRLRQQSGVEANDSSAPKHDRQ